MKLEALPDDFIDALIAEPPYKRTVNLICVCGSPLDMGYCRSPDCKWDAVEETFPCDWCGCCPDPKHCVWSVTCPICASPPKSHCKEGTKLVGLHGERWSAAGITWQL